MTRSDCVATPPMATALEPGRSLYEAYENWKGWSKPFVYSAQEAEYFGGECRGVGVAGADVLEIGFGFGAFLAWARDQGARVAGTEINPVSLEAARASGIELLPSDFETVAMDYAGRFDTIAAFDVFEHFTIEEIVARLAAAEIMLRPGGRLVLRFPNAQSPFGLTAQFGDPTHKSALSRGVFEQLVGASNLEVERYASAFRTVGSGLLVGLVRRTRHLARDIVSGLLNAVYGASIPWDPVVVLVLRKAGRRSDERARDRLMSVSYQQLGFCQMIEDDEDRRRSGSAAGKAASHEIGQPLDALSLAEFDERIALLRAEIERLEAARAAKAASLAAADAFFKK